MHFTLLLALAASTALAEQDLFLGFGEKDDSERSRSLKRGLNCTERARTPDDDCYFKSLLYKSKPRAQKLVDLWSKILPDSSVVEKPDDFKWADFPKFFTQRAPSAFCTAGDELNRKHSQKAQHTQGLVAQVQWIPVANNGYSGVYAEGSETVVMRLSETNNLYEGAKGLTPSVAFKFLIDERESENIFAASSFQQSDSWNFFENPLKNRVINKQELEEMDDDNVTNEIIKETFFKKIVEGASKPFALGVSNIADTGNSGAKVPFEETVSPYELRFKSPLSGRFSRTKTSNEWYDDIKSKVHMGENLFEVYAYTVASEDGPETEVKIADVRLQTPLYTSRWGDENLYFRHRPVFLDKKFWSKNVKRVNEDPQVRREPENIWGRKVPEGVWPTDPAEAKAKYIDQMNTYGCPFAWLLNLN